MNSVIALREDDDHIVGGSKFNKSSFSNQDFIEHRSTRSTSMEMKVYSTFSLFLSTDMRNVHVAIFVEVGTFGVPLFLWEGVEISFLLGFEIPLIQLSIFGEMCEHASCKIVSTVVVQSRYLRIVKILKYFFVNFKA